MLAVFTDFGYLGPYLGQMQAVLVQQAPGVPIINLMADAPAFNPRASAYLLSALAGGFPRGTVFLCVVDPGVGTAKREPVAVEADGRWFVGPGNGLFELVSRRAAEAHWRKIVWRPEAVSASFHGRDIFAPVAAAIARGEVFGLDNSAPDRTGADWPDDLPEVVYIDGYGNAVTGLRGTSISAGTQIRAGGRWLEGRNTFGEAEVGSAFWYVNSSGLVELAVNQGRAETLLDLSIGSPVTVGTRAP